MTREEIEKLPDIIDMFLSESLIIDTKEKVHKKLTEVCNLAIQALEEQDNPNSIRINFVGEEEAEEFKRYEKELLEKLKKQPLTVIPKEQPCDDCVSRKSVEDIIKDTTMPEYLSDILNDKINNLHSVTPSTQWHKIKTRPLTDEEKEEYGEEYTFMYDCKMPDDGQEVLVKTQWGIEKTTYYTDYGFYFEDYEDKGDVIAWMPLSKWEG